jgi:hypothetical protein
MWVAFTAAGNMLVNLFQAAENATAVADKALSNDVAQIGQNVSDKGVIVTLLPPDKETSFTDKVNEVKQTVAQVKDAVN